MKNKNFAWNCMKDDLIGSGPIETGLRMNDDIRH